MLLLACCWECDDDNICTACCVAVTGLVAGLSLMFYRSSSIALYVAWKALEVCFFVCWCWCCCTAQNVSKGPRMSTTTIYDPKEVHSSIIIIQDQGL